jgi:TonB family protein
MNLAHYLLQVNIYLIVFYGFYRLLLDRETYFMLNRIYLISAACFSLLIPFIRLDWITAQPATQNISVGVSQLYMVAGLNENTGPGITWGSSIALLYVIGLCVFLTRFIIQLLSIRKLTQQVPKGTAFSFFNKLFIHDQLPGQDVISKHEQIHMRQLHSVDVIFFELLGVFIWFNPVIYLFKQSVKNIHEYLADEQAAQFQGNKEQYSLLLLSSAFGVNPSTLTNSFFNKSLIKKRIIMLHKQKSTRTAILKYGLFLPLFAVTLILSSATIRKNEGIRVAAESIPLDQPLKVVTDALPAAGTKQAHGLATLQVGTLTQQEKVYDFTSVDTAPTFPGGMEAFYSFIGKSIKYPREAAVNKVQGKVFLSFIIEKDGKVSRVHVDRRLGSGTDEEAVRVLESSPSWNPGLKDKQPVRVMYHMPISFSLIDTKAPEAGKPTAAKSNTPDIAQAQSAKPKQANSLPPAAAVYMIDGKLADADKVFKLDPKNIERMDVTKASNNPRVDGKLIHTDLISVTTKAAKANTATK